MIFYYRAKTDYRNRFLAYSIYRKEVDKGEVEILQIAEKEIADLLVSTLNQQLIELIGIIDKIGWSEDSDVKT